MAVAVLALLEGYQSRRPLSDLELDMLPTMVRRCAHGLTLWHLQRFIEEPTARQQHRIAELQHRIGRLHGKDADIIRSVTGR